tara:strand:- start:199 stop:405 length:207 start_codon:yes stop_codon:yes gene_type:complete
MDKDLKQELEVLLNSIPLTRRAKRKIKKEFGQMSGVAAILLFNDFRQKAQTFMFSIETITRYSHPTKK